MACSFSDQKTGYPTTIGPKIADAFLFIEAAAASHYCLISARWVLALVSEHERRIIFWEFPGGSPEQKTAITQRAGRK
jgi:hypothetical protein